MPSQRSFWLATIAAAIVCGAIIQGVSVAEIGKPAPRPALPLPGVSYVSATFDGQTDHSLYYFDFFGFGDRIRNADTLVVGSSHAECGLEASRLGRRPFNIGLGGSEGLAFAAALLRKYQPHPSLLVVDSYGPDEGLSTEGRRTLGSTSRESLHYVLNIWSGFLRDWLLQGLLPRLTIRFDASSWDQPMRVVTIRDWRTADVRSIYSGKTGEAYAEPSQGKPMPAGALRSSISPAPADLAAIRAVAAPVLVTTVPYPGYDTALGRQMAAELGGRFADIDPGELRFFDFHHLTARGRALATEWVQKAKP